MKKAILILGLTLIALFYYLGFFSKRDTLPLSSDFFSARIYTERESAFDLKEIGFLKRKSSESRNIQITQKELETLYQTQLDRGVKNLPTVSLFLLRKSKEAREKGEIEKAQELTTYAMKISPDLSQPHLEMARIYWAKNPLHLHKVFSEILKGQFKKFQDYPSLLRLSYHGLYLLSNAVLMSFILFGIVILIKYLPLYFYDLRKNLSQELQSLLINGLKVFVLFLPLFFRFDLIWSLFFWSTLLWGYVSQREKKFIVFFLIIATYFPFFLRASSSFLNSSNSEILLEMNEANHGNWTKMTEERLKGWIRSQPNDSEVLFTLGLIAKKQGQYQQAEEYYRKAIESHPRFSQAFSNLGNVYIAQKQIPLAISAYQQAIQIDPHKGAYYYNLSRAYSQETFLSGKIDRTFQKARELDPRLIDFHSMVVDSPHMNRFVIDESLSPHTLWQRCLNQFMGREGFLYLLFKAWFERIPSVIPFLAPILFLTFLIALSRYARAKRFITRCPMCGSPTHRFYLETQKQEFICFNCYRLFVQKETLHPKIMEKKSLQAKAFQKEEQVISAFLSYLFTGFGYLWRGQSLKGLILLFLFFIFILRFLFWDGLIPEMRLQSFRSPFLVILWGGLFLLFYLLYIWDFRRQKPRFEIEVQKD